MVRIIIQPSQQHPTMGFAGEELVRHLQMLPIVFAEYPVVLGLDDKSEQAADRFSYSFTNAGGWITGATPRSILLGVYDYLRAIGFVFCRPGDGGTFVPQLSALEEIYRTVTEKVPALRHRGVCIEGADALENVLDFIDWLPKNGYNAFFLQFKQPNVFFERWYQHIFNPTLPCQSLTKEQMDGFTEQITQAITLRGLEDHRVGHGWTAEALGYANTGWHVEDDSLTPDVRQMVAQIHGKRQLFGGIPTNTNLCYANQAARQALIQQILAYAREHPQVDYLHFWLADEPNNVCECEQCVQTTLSDQYVQILNELDRALTREGLSTKIVFLLYQELLYAPIKERLEHPERFCLMFAPISRTFEKSYPKQAIPAGIQPYVRNHFRLPQTVEENLAHYASWKACFAGDSFFYDYPLGRAHYGDFGYMKIAKVIYEDIHTLKDLGTNGYMSCQELRAMTPTAFPNFVMGQALFDLSLSYEDLKRTFFAAQYGEGYETVIEYLQQLSDLSDTDYVNGHGPRKQPEKKTQFHQIAETALAFLMDMDELHPHNPKFERQWEMLKFHGRYCILLSYALGELCQGNQEAADQYFRELYQFLWEHELEYQPYLDVYRVIEVSTKYTGFSKL